MFDTCRIKQQRNIDEYSESQIIILHQHVSVTPVTIFRVSHNENTVSTQIVVKMCDKTFNNVQNCKIKPFNVIQKCMIKPLMWYKMYDKTT
jgi:hypothetical protein